MAAKHRFPENRVDGLPPPSPGGIRARTIVLAAILVVIAYFLGHSIWTQWNAIRSHPWRLNTWWLVCSAAVMWVDFVIIIGFWRYLLFAVTGRRLHYGLAFRIVVLSNLAKYVPGKVWTVLGMVYLLRQEGYPATLTLVSTILHQAFTVISGVVFVLVVLGSKVFGGLPVGPMIAGCAIGLAVLYPPIFRRLLNAGLRLVKREPVQFELSFIKAAGLFGAYVLTWIVYGASFWCMLKGVGVDPMAFWDTVAAFSGAYLLGFLALFAPGGLGVREGALAVLLAPHLSPGMAALIAVVSRLWMTVLEVTQLIPLALGWGKDRSAAAQRSTEPP